MPIYSVQGPDGRIYDVEGPAGASDAQIISFLRRQLVSAAPTEPAIKPESGFLPALKAGARGLAGDIAALDDCDQRQQHNDADGDVNAVEARQRVERRTKQARRIAEALVVHRGELVHLATNERGAEQTGDRQPQGCAAVVTLLRRGNGQNHCE